MVAGYCSWMRNLNCFLNDCSLLRALLQPDDSSRGSCHWLQQSQDLPGLGPGIVLLLPFGLPVCSCQQLKVVLSCFRVPWTPCVAAFSLPDGASLQKWLFLLLELLIFSVPILLSHCIFGCVPLLPPAVSLSVSCVFSVLLFQHCFMMPQSLGVIGGKPNSAHYFIGYVGECPEYRKTFQASPPS